MAAYTRRIPGRAGAPGAPACLLLSLWLMLGAGCYSFEAKPIDAAANLDQFESRSLADPALQPLIEESNLQRTGSPWPPPVWDLDALTIAALYFNPDLEAARARLSAAEAARITAGQMPNPTLNISPAYSANVPAPSPWIVTVSLDVPIETAGKRRLRGVRAEQLSEAAKQDIAMTAWTVRARLRQAVLGLWSAQASQELLDSRRAIQEDIVGLLEAQLAAGEVGPSEVARERITLQQTRLALLEAQSKAQQARIQLAGVIGVPPAALDELRIEFAALVTAAPEISAAAARRAALLGRADIAAALAEYAASETALQLEVAKQYPDVHLGPGYEFDQRNNKWGLGLGIELPLLNQNAGPIAEAEAQRRQRAAAFTALQAHVLGEIDAALAAYDAAKQAVAAADNGLAEASRQESRAASMLAVGEVGRLALASARAERSVAALARLDTVVRMQQALGQVEAALQLPLSGRADGELSALRAPGRIEESNE